MEVSHAGSVTWNKLLKKSIAMEFIGTILVCVVEDSQARHPVHKLIPINSVTIQSLIISPLFCTYWFSAYHSHLVHTDEISDPLFVHNVFPIIHNINPSQSINIFRYVDIFSTFTNKLHI